MRRFGSEDSRGLVKANPEGGTAADEACEMRNV